MYVVLMKVNADGTLPMWAEVGRTDAPDGAAAIRNVAETGIDGNPLSGVFVAVPARSFQPAGLRFENVQKPVWEDTPAPAEPTPEPEPETDFDPTA